MRESISQAFRINRNSALTICYGFIILKHYNKEEIFVRRFIFYPAFFIFILFLLETASFGMGATPLQPPVQEPAVVSPAPDEKQEQGTVKPDDKKPPKAILPEPTSSKPGETGALVQPPTETPTPTEVKQPAPEQAGPVEQVVPPKPPKAPRMRASEAAVTFFFDDADIFEVAHTVFGEVLKVNYIIDPKVKGRVTFRTVTPIPRDEVLPIMEIILRLNGIGFVEEQGLYRIVPLTEVPKELVYAQVGKEPDKVAIELFTFKNVNIKDSMADIENAIGLTVKGGTVRALPIYRLNALMVIASTKEQMDYVRKWVSAFDGMFAVARPKIFVYPLQNSKAAHVASLLQSIFSGGAPSAPPTTAPKTEPLKTTPSTSSLTTPSPTTTTPSSPKLGAAAVATGTGFLVSPDTRVFADEIANSLIILAISADYAFIEETVKKIDTLPRQVVIEGLIASVTLTDKLDFGIQWTIQNDLTIKGFKPFDRNINISGPLTLDTRIPSPTFTFTAYDAANQVKLLLQSLASEGKAKILAAPHILVSDNREARIQVGSQVPIATSTTATPIGTGTTVTTTTTSTVQYKDIGIILKVKPQVNDSGLVSLEISQEVSSIGAEKIIIANQAFDSIDKTEATTNLVAQDGETIIIGGLIREDITKSRSGIPFLSKIPILGYLFGSTIDETKRTELIILLTPRVMKNQQEARDITSDYVDRYRGSTKDKQIDEFIKDKGKKEQDGKDTKNKDSK